MSRVTESDMDEGSCESLRARSDEPEARSEARWSARRTEGWSCGCCAAGRWICGPVSPAARGADRRVGVRSSWPATVRG